MSKPSREDYEAVLAYLHVCIRMKDWHGVADAACDLRVMEAFNPELMQNTVPTAQQEVPKEESS